MFSTPAIPLICNKAALFIHFQPCWLRPIRAPSCALSNSEDGENPLPWQSGLQDESKCERGHGEEQEEVGEQSQALQSGELSSSQETDVTGASLISLEEGEKQLLEPEEER